MWCGGRVLFAECLGDHCADGGCGGGVMGIGLVFGVSLQGGLSAWVWALSRHSSLGVYSNQNLLGTLPGGWGFWGL